MDITPSRLERIKKYQTSFNKLGLRSELVIENRVYYSDRVEDGLNVYFKRKTYFIKSNPTPKKRGFEPLQRMAIRTRKQDGGKIMKAVLNMISRLASIPSKRVNPSKWDIHPGLSAPWKRPSCNYFVNFETMRVRVWPSANAPAGGFYDWKIAPENAEYKLNCMTGKDHYGIPVDETSYRLIGFDGRESGWAYKMGLTWDGMPKTFRGKTLKDAIAKALEAAL